MVRMWRSTAIWMCSACGEPCRLSTDSSFWVKTNWSSNVRALALIITTSVPVAFAWTTQRCWYCLLFPAHGVSHLHCWTRVFRPALGQVMLRGGSGQWQDEKHNSSFACLKSTAEVLKIIPEHNISSYLFLTTEGSSFFLLAFETQIFASSWGMIVSMSLKWLPPTWGTIWQSVPITRLCFCFHEWKLNYTDFLPWFLSGGPRCII